MNAGMPSEARIERLISIVQQARCLTVSQGRYFRTTGMISIEKLQ